MLKEPSRFVDTNVFVEVETFICICVLNKAIFDRLMVLFTDSTVVGFGRKTMLKRTRHARPFHRILIEC